MWIAGRSCAQATASPFATATSKPPTEENACITEHPLALFGMREKLRQPGDGRDKLDADAHENKTPQHQQHHRRSRVAGSKGCERIDEDAPRQHARLLPADR